MHTSNSYNVDSYKAVTVVLFSEHERNGVAVHRLIEIQFATQTDPWQTVQLLDYFLKIFLHADM